MKVHLPWQVLALLVSLAGVGIGIKLADVTDIDIGGSTHTILGLLIVFASPRPPTSWWLLAASACEKEYESKGNLGFRTYLVWEGDDSLGHNQWRTGI